MNFLSKVRKAEMEFDTDKFIKLSHRIIRSVSRKFPHFNRFLVFIFSCFLQDLSIFSEDFLTPIFS